MATANIKKEDDDPEQWQTTQGMREPHHWTDSSEDDNEDVDTNEFFDAHDTEFQQNQSPSTQTNTEAKLLHERLNADLSTNETVTKKSPEDPYFIDEDLLIERDALLTDEEKETRYQESKTSKDEGNNLFGRGEYDQALEKYSNALCLCPMKNTRDRAVVYSNRAACLMKMEKYEAAVQSCTASIKYDPTYVKPILRRADSYKAIDKLEEALQDYQKVLELEPTNAHARKEVYILPDRIKERNEKMKEEMLGKLKELGNMVLKPFGLSTNNFKLQQDPSTGSYSVNFQK
ncbi:unnamed protein product [Rotaria socialis]|uniref:Tetratricopeptide repeat protein 1 n=2 Tax=Rotaria socialis TaxID=392032 RepID=A0A817YRG9_9BILA|nr:unnamed protein product [Rotaria socialis]CAF3385337.1 unnamed protein product [Rotaria socialis]CAF3683962.1 unnamed protein product [Rotaria socialis]CAF4361055.1 unnamed protein product [Rotaria socialis]CAF4479694.1 unnamed protein product [Rotaria socialis]